MSISTGYRPISRDDITDDLLVGWKDHSIPANQRLLADRQLREMHRGSVQNIFKILAKCVKESYVENSTILEIGCATGYYYEILNHLLKTKINYTGIDFSEGMIELARKHYPEAEFILADGAKMPFGDKQFSIVVSGSILLHTLNYEQHIKETCRVAKDRVIVHRTPIHKKNPTLLQEKQAYGIRVLEIRFNESELLNLFEEEGWKLLERIEYISKIDEDKFQMTHLLERK